MKLLLIGSFIFPMVELQSCLISLLTSLQTHRSCTRYPRECELSGTKAAGVSCVGGKKKRNQLVEKLVTVNCNTGVFGAGCDRGSVIMFEVKKLCREILLRGR